MTLIVLAGAAAYVAFLLHRLGMPRRALLAMRPVAYDAVVAHAAAAHGDRPLFTTDAPVAWQVPQLRDRYPDPCVWSAARIHEVASYVANALHSTGSAAGDRTALLKTNHLDMHVLMTAIIRTGAIACPINDRMSAPDVDHYLQHIGAGTLISDVATMQRLLRENTCLPSIRTIILTNTAAVSGPLIAQFREQLPEVTVVSIESLWPLRDPLPTAGRDYNRDCDRARDDTLYLVHSSGTTGFPKAVVLENARQAHALRGWLCYVHLSATADTGYLAVPNNHQAVILTFHGLLRLGLRTHWTQAYHRGEFDAHRVARELAAGRYTGFFAFPVAYTLLKEVPLHEHDLSGMRFWASTADASHEFIQRRFTAIGGALRSVGLPVSGSIYLDAQGSSEVGTPSVIRYVTRFTRKHGRRIGRPGSSPFGPQTRVIRADDTPAAIDEPGRYEVKGATVFPRYWNDAELTAQVIRDGWFFTGDVVRRAPDGHFIQLDREVDVMLTAAGAVFTLPIEEVVHKHPAVFDVCVYGAYQPDGTQVPAAAVALRTGITLSGEELMRELNAQLSPSDELQRVDIMPWSEFPMGVTGKTLKRVFRERSRQLTANGELIGGPTRL